MRKNKKRIFAWLMMAIMVISLFSFPVFAASETPTENGDLIKTEQFTTTKTEDFQYDFEENIKENGKKYKLKSISYDVLSSEPIQREEQVIHTVDYKNRYSKDVQPAETLEITKDGKPLTVTFSDLSYTPTTITNRSETVSAYTDFSYKTVTPQPNQTKTITYYDNASGKNITATLPLKELKLVDDWAWRDDVTIPIEFSLYDAEYYALGDKLVPYNDEKPALQGYENDLLAVLNLDTNKYKITNITWDGEPYYVGEVRYRKAIATGERYAANYVAVYESKVELPNVPGYNAVATYTNTVDVNSGEREYTVQATAVYERDYTVATVVAGVFLGLLFIALFVVLVLFIFTKKQKKEQKNIS